MSTNAADDITFTSQGCQRPIHGNTGYVGTDSVAADAALEAPGHPPIPWEVPHYDYDPHPDRDDYCRPIARVVSLLNLQGPRGPDCSHQLQAVRRVRFPSVTGEFELSSI